jgi:hypothetical protein
MQMEVKDFAALNAAIVPPSSIVMGDSIWPRFDRPADLSIASASIQFPEDYEVTEELVRMAMQQLEDKQLVSA